MSLTGSELHELELLDELLKGDAWKIYARNIMSRHRIHLLEQCNTHLKKHEDRKAGEFLARAEEWPKLHKMFVDRVKELRELKDSEV